MRTPGEDAVLGFAEAINPGDRAAAVAFCHPEIEFLSVLAVSGTAYVGHDGVRQYFDDGLSEQTGHVWTLTDGKLLRNEPYRETEAALREVGDEP